METYAMTLSFAKGSVIRKGIDINIKPFSKRNDLFKLQTLLASKMKPPYLVIQDYSDITPKSIINYLLRYAPRLTDNADLKRLKKLTSDKE